MKQRVTISQQTSRNPGFRVESGPVGWELPGICSKRALQVLFVEDDDADADLVEAAFDEAGVAVALLRASTEVEMRSILSSARDLDAILCDYSLPGFDGLRALEVRAELAPDLPLLMVSGGLTDERAAECMRHGAADYVTKDRLGRLQHALHQAVDRARAEKAARASETNYSRLFQDIPLAIVRTTPDGRILQANPTGVAMFGFADMAEMTARTVGDLYVDPEDRSILLAGLESDGQVTNFECRMRRPDGTEFWFSSAAHVIRGDDNSIVEIESFGADVTSRKAAELELAQSEERLRGLLVGAPVGVVTVDLDGKFTYAGGSIFAQLGIDPDALVGRDLATAFPGREDLAELFAAARERDLQVDVELNQRSFHLRLGPFRLSPTGPVIGTRGVSFENTEQVAALAQLSRRARQQTLLQELARQGLESQEAGEFLATAVELVARGAGVEFGSILEMQPGEEAMVVVASWGHPPTSSSEPVRISAAFRTVEALKSSDPVMVINWAEDTALERSPWMVKAGVLTSMGVGIRGPLAPYGLIAVHSSVPRVFDADDVQFMQLAGTIVSVAIERKRADRQRRLLLTRVVDAQEAERKTIAEDIHDDAVQVMTAANMRLELFRMQLTDPAQVEVAEKLQETVMLATGRLRNLLFDLKPPALERYGIEAALRMHLERFRAETGVEYTLDSNLVVEPPTQMRIVLFRIFQEALANVRKHAQAANLSVVLDNQDGGVQMRVTDDGVGFSSTRLPEAAPGHLGLASMSERAEMAGGWFRLQGQPGKGAEVTVWLPCPATVEPSDPEVAVMALD
ncbi:MAG: hypothetical protein NVS3B24_00900 [Candidatus Dormibacteria bacterium]